MKAGRIDVWINHVGQGISRLPSDLTEADIDEMMRVNVKSALIRSAYSASKHFLDALSDNFRTELRASHPNV